MWETDGVTSLKCQRVRSAGGKRNGAEGGVEGRGRGDGLSEVACERRRGSRGDSTSCGGAPGGGASGGRLETRNPPEPVQVPGALQAVGGTPRAPLEVGVTLLAWTLEGCWLPLERDQGVRSGQRLERL